MPIRPHHPSPFQRSSAALILTLCVGLTALAEPAAETATDSADTALRIRLEALLAGTLAPSIDAVSLFTVPLDDRAAVADRVSSLLEQAETAATRLESMREQLRELEARVQADATRESTAALDDAPGAPPNRAPENPPPLAEPEPAPHNLAETSQGGASERLEIQREVEVLRERFTVAELRRSYLERLLERLGNASEAAQRILPTLGRPQDDLGKRASDIDGLANRLESLSQRLRVTAERSRAGVLVGFVSEQRSIADELASTAGIVAEAASRLRSRSRAWATQAESIESEGQRVRQAFFRAAARDAGQADLDAMFLTRLRAQRLLRKRVDDTRAIPEGAEILALQAEADAIATDPSAIVTTTAARSALAGAIENHRRVLDLAAAEQSAVSGWELAFENALVSVLSEQASPDAREDAYALSSEWVDDVRSEGRVAWERMRAGFESQRASIPTLRALLTEPAGHGYLKKLAALLAILGSWLALKRQTPRITVSLVKALARSKSFRGRVGILVRWSGLVQSVLPPILALLGLWIAVWILRDSPTPAQLAWAIGFPLCLYAIGRQLLIGATRRITTGRPALIEILPATLEKLTRTYATLGWVVAIAYILDGTARVVIGAGRLVALIDGAVLVWVGVWAAWETIRWRIPLARAWSRVVPETPEEEPPSLEANVASWMETSAFGFLLSGPALLRVALTPAARAVSATATDTNVVQTIRAWLLRRRSRKVEISGEASGELPEEYLEAFPLHPILGEDDALLVSREELLETILAQFKTWKQSQADGSLALIGEKGIGKTTLAAQISRKVDDIELVQHTIRGKPTTREELIAALSAAFEAPPGLDLEGLTQWLCEGPERVILLDEAHNVFLRRVDGYGAYDALIDLVNATTSKVFWVVLFNSFTWRFLNESRGRVHYFRKLVQVPNWTAEEIQKLVLLRNKRTGFELRFNDLLLSDDRTQSGGLELVEESEGYFRLLWESSGGNPRIATKLWLSSLSFLREKQLAVGLFRESSSEALSGVKDDVLFSLAAICQHENLSAAELARVLNLPEGFARFAIQYLNESGVLEAKDASGERYTLAPTHYRAALRLLRRRHLIFD